MRAFGLGQKVCLLLSVLLVGGDVEASTSEAAEIPETGQTVILFVLDNSASLPPLDPLYQRQTALEKMFEFVDGQPYRLILFGGKDEVYVDTPERYQNNGQWTDFYYAFEKAKEIIEIYPEGTRFKMILITDGIIDPQKEDWKDQDIEAGIELSDAVEKRTLDLLEQMNVPLYIMLIQDQSGSVFAQEMVQAANGSLANNQYAQGITEFFDDDGIVLRRFIYYLEPEKGLEQIEPIVRRIAKPASVSVEFSLVSALLLTVGVLIGIGVRSFPGPGDKEHVDLRIDQPLHISVDRLRKLPTGAPAWSRRGLSVSDSSKDASATFTLIEGGPAFPPNGFDISTMDEIPKELVRLPLPDLKRRMDELLKSGNKAEMIEALNLDYVAPDFDAFKAEKLLTMPEAERRTRNVMDFLRAKIHLLHNDPLCAKLTEPRVSCLIYGSKGVKRELRVGERFDLGRYTYRIDSLEKGGRKDYRMTLSYDGAPSALYLKRIVPVAIQQLLRFRRSHERLVA